jgi:hypothetical protein
MGLADRNIDRFRRSPGPCGRRPRPARTAPRPSLPAAVLRPEVLGLAAFAGCVATGPTLLPRLLRAPPALTAAVLAGSNRQRRCRRDPAGLPGGRSCIGHSARDLRCRRRGWTEDSCPGHQAIHQAVMRACCRCSWGRCCSSGRRRSWGRRCSYSRRWAFHRCCELAGRRRGFRPGLLDCAGSDGCRRDHRAAGRDAACRRAFREMHARACPRAVWRGKRRASRPHLPAVAAAAPRRRHVRCW